jgi:hypothetical protein
MGDVLDEGDGVDGGNNEKMEVDSRQETEEGTDKTGEMEVEDEDDDEEEEQDPEEEQTEEDIARVEGSFM